MHNLQQSQVRSNQDNDTCGSSMNQQARTKPKFFTFRRWVLVISLMTNIPMLEFAWKAYNKVNFDRKFNVKLSLPDRKCRPLSQMKNKAENVTQNQNFVYFAVGFSVISLTRNELKLESCLESMQQTQNRLQW